MNLVRAYHRCVRICTVTGVLAYCVAAQNIGLALLAVSLMMVIWLWIAVHERGAGGDTARRGIAPRWVINLLVLLLTLNMVRQAFGGMLFPGASPAEEGGRDLIGILAQYMIWLQLVKMLEPRSPRDQAQLLALNAMLIIAAVLTSVTLAVGLMVIAYLPVFLLAVLLYQVFAGHERGVQAARKALGDTVSAFRSPLAAGPKALMHVRMTAAVCGVMILVLGIAVFIIMPRGVLKSFFADVQPPESGAVTGFTPEVQLGMAGRLSESREVVMELEVFLGGAPLVLTHKPYYLRGTSLDTYDPQTGVWRTLRDKPLYDRTGSTLPPKNSQFASVEQRITLRNKVTDHLFAVWRPVHIAFPGGGSVRRSQTDETIRLEGRRGAFTYWVRSAPYDDLPEAEDARPAENAGPDAQTAAHPFGPGSPIHALAQELVRRAGLERDRETVSDPADERIAGLFRDYLQNNYVYTTEMIAPRPGQDPIEMFLFETRRGHCEYFASAMAALCQSMGMRARVVTGFVASEYDEVQEKYLVRENNAHAWVEVLVNETRWRTYDPSPPDGLRLAHQPPDGLLSPLERLFDRLEMAWTTSVISFDNTSQARIFGQGSNAELPMPAFLERLTDYFGYGDSQKRPKVDPAELFKAASVAFVAVFSAVAGLLLLLNPLTSRLALRFPRLAILRTSRGAAARRGERARDDPDAARRREQQAFYRRMLHVMAHLRSGAFAKPDWRPPLEHARAISPRDAEVGAAAARLSELYYRSRFGRVLLTAEELAAARVLVAAIEQRLRSSGRETAG